MAKQDNTGDTGKDKKISKKKPVKKTAKKPTRKKAVKKIGKDPKRAYSTFGMGGSNSNTVKKPPHSGQFKKGTNIWELRTKHGRDVLFTTPEALWEAAAEYFKWVDENPLFAHEAKVVSNGYSKTQKGGSKVEIVEIPKKRVYTMQGLCIYLDCGTKYFYNFKKSLEEKTDEKSNYYKYILEKIEETIYTQKFEGATSGLFKDGFIKADLGIVDRTDITTKGEKMNLPSVGNLSMDEIEKLLEKHGE